MTTNITTDVTIKRGLCTMTRREMIDEYFIENRTKLLDLAAFLDRLDRAGEEVTKLENDFRVEALREAFRVLIGESTSRVKLIQMILSDPATQPLEELDRKSAWGAFESPKISNADDTDTDSKEG